MNKKKKQEDKSTKVLILLIGIVIGAIFVSVLIENDLVDQYMKTEECDELLLEGLRVGYITATGQEVERMCRTGNITIFEPNKTGALVIYNVKGTNVSRRDVTINEACDYYQQLN